MSLKLHVDFFSSVVTKNPYVSKYRSLVKAGSTLMNENDAETA
jgi:hypothetical protein